MQDDEDRLIERAVAGDDAAVAVLCRRHEGAVRRRVYQRLPRQLRRRISVADVAQETLLTAVQRLRAGAWTHEGSFRAWLLRIAEYKAREATRFHLGTAKRALGAELSQPHRPDTGAFAGGLDSPSTVAMEEESCREIDAGLAALPRDYRLVIDLIHRRGCTMVEAGEHLDRSADAVRKLYARAIAALARHLNPEDDRDESV